MPAKLNIIKSAAMDHMSSSTRLRIDALVPINIVQIL